MSQPSPEKFFLGRQPILNRSQEIIGYELLFRAAERNIAEFDSYSYASTSVISSALSSFGFQEILAGKLGFLNVHLGLLLSEMLELLPIKQTVLELLEIITIDDEVVERCRELRRFGFKIALDDHEFTPDDTRIYDVTDIVKLDILQIGMDKLPEIVSALRKWPVKLLAEKVETVEQFDVCFALGFELFQGYFFERPVVLNRRRLDLSGMAMLKLLQQLTTDASVQEIEQTFKENPSISYSLLRLVNSVATGLREKIKNLRHAILLLGTEQLRRWTQLSLFACNDTRGNDNPLLEMAAVRGRLMEILVLQRNGSSAPSEQSEAAFMTGILSLLEILFETPMEEILANLNLTDDVSSALLERSGDLGKLLQLAERIEMTDFDAVTPLLSECRISLDQLLTAQLEAFNWRANLIAPSS